MFSRVVTDYEIVPPPLPPPRSCYCWTAGATSHFVLALLYLGEGGQKR